MMEKFAADDRLEQMNAQRRRMKQAEHRRAVEQLIEERRKRAEFERQQALYGREEEIKEEEAHRALIEEERQRLLKEHAHKVKGRGMMGLVLFAGALSNMAHALIFAASSCWATSRAA